MFFSPVYFQQNSQRFSVKIKVRSCHFSTQNPTIAFTSFRIKSEVNITNYKEVHDLGSLYFSNLIFPEFTLLCCLAQASGAIPQNLCTGSSPSLGPSDEESASQKTFSTTQCKISTPCISQLSFLCFTPLNTYYNIYLFYIFTLLITYLPHEILNSMWARFFCLLCSWLYPPWWRQCLAVMDRIFESLQIHMLKPLPSIWWY